MEQSTTQRLHIVDSTDWKDAVISLLEPRSSYRPWRHEAYDAAEGDLIAFVLNTDPQSMLTVLARPGKKGKPFPAAFDRPLRQPTLVETSTLAAMIDIYVFAGISWSFSGDDAAKLEEALSECRYASVPESRFGHNSMAAARTLLRYHGRCDGCGRTIDLAGSDARERIFVHTVDPYPRPASATAPPAWSRSDATDWPSVICRNCRNRMRAEGHQTFLDYKFAQHPPCPECGARRTLTTFYGMPADITNNPPWRHAGGCCPQPQEWCCGVCYHQW